MKTFELVRREHPARLIMVGDGPDRAEAEAYCPGRRASQQEVRFTGKQLDIDTVLACSDLFLLPSATESFGLAALEAMAPPGAGHRQPGGRPARSGAPRRGRLPGAPGRRGGHGPGLPHPAARTRTAPGAWALSAQERALTTFAEGPVIDQYEALYERVLAPAKSIVDLQPQTS